MTRALVSKWVVPEAAVIATVPFAQSIANDPLSLYVVLHATRAPGCGAGTGTAATGAQCTKRCATIWRPV